MTILPVIVLCALVLVAAYLVYGRLVARWLGLDPNRTTPAVANDDGNDFVPAPAPVVLGGHFTAIAAAGPVVGPILAGLAFGWVPALIWIILGAIFIGGVHDSGSLLASIRHNATSITQVVRRHVSPTAYFTFLIFVWMSLLYVIVAFADVTAGSFARLQQLQVSVDDRPMDIRINGGAIVVGAAAYLLFSVIMGLGMRLLRIPWWALLGVMVVALGLVIHHSPDLARWLAAHGLSFLDTGPEGTADRQKAWALALLAYCFLASIVPLWLLLQPRGVIGAAFLYATLVFGVVGTVAGGFGGPDGSLAIRWPAFGGFLGDKLGGPALAGAWLFPFLFITIACGACSGFHSIVSSGTTCKQVRSEADVKPIGYGAMLLEAMVAVFALSCVMVMAPGMIQGRPSPDGIYARGIGNFMAQVGIDMTFAITFGLLAFSSFVFDTLDVCTRLARYIFQELLGIRGLAAGAFATLASLAPPALYLWSSPPGAFFNFWIIFGTSNQLLAALTLVGVGVWLWRTGRPAWFAILPAAFMLLTTGTALVLNFLAFLRHYRGLLSPEDIAQKATPLLVNMAIAATLFALGLLVVVEAVRVWLRVRAAALPVVRDDAPAAGA